jgi:alkanesulfonate monooxygenase SsuD/methylene tetrahydromethanopterin reductase-like flavin-dependent oxidoreductase (luciferase family)
VKRSVVLSMQWVQELSPLARRAEAAGLYRVWTTEYNTYDAIVRAALIAATTSAIQVGTGITYAFTRRPVALAAAAADVQAASGGRFTLGLGMGTNGMRSKWYDLQLDAPARRFTEVVRLLRAAQTAAGGLHFQGDYDSTDIPGYVLPDAATAATMEIWGSGVNAAMLTAAARCCDGIAAHPLTLSPAYWNDAVETAVARGLHEDGSRAKIAAWVLTSVNSDEDEARWQARRNLAFYFSTPSYRTAATGATWAGAAARILEQARTGGTQDLNRLAALVPDAMLDDLTISGSPAQVRERMRGVESDLAGRGVDEIVFQLASRGSGREQTVRSCAAIIDSAAREGADA